MNFGCMLAQSSLPPKLGQSSGLLECYELKTGFEFISVLVEWQAFGFERLVIAFGLAAVRRVFVILAFVQQVSKQFVRRIFALVLAATV